MGFENDIILSVILPAYQEEENLETCVEETIKTINPLNEKFEIIIVENGSNDNTFKIAQSLSDKYNFVQGIHLENPSFGGAIKKGHSMARGKIIINLDVDLSTDMTYFKDLFENSKKYDMVTGSRYINHKIVNRSFTRLLLSQFFNKIFIRGLLNSKIKDNNCGFRAIRKEVGIKIFPLVQNEGDFGMVEFIILAQRQNYTIKEIPVKWDENETKVGIKKIIVKFLIPTIRLWCRLKFSKN
jgi:glycosyltransferase AglD